MSSHHTWPRSHSILSPEEMIRPIRTGIHLALASSVAAGISAALVPSLVRFSMLMVMCLSALLAWLLSRASETHAVWIQRRIARMNGLLLRTTSILVGISAVKIGMELYGTPLIRGIGAWMTVLAVLHFAIAFWDRKALKRSSRRWRSRKISFAVHLGLSLLIGVVHAMLVLNG